MKKLQKRQMEKEALCEKLQADIDDQVILPLTQCLAGLPSAARNESDNFT